MPTISPGEGFILVLIALGVVFWYFNKKSGGKLLSTAEADATALLHKTVASQAQSIATLAPVVASAPVQAVVNAPASSQPAVSTHQFTLGVPMVIAPAGAPAPSANQTFPLDPGRKWYPSPGLRDSNGAAINGYVVDAAPAIVLLPAQALPAGQPPPAADQSGCGNGDATRVWYTPTTGGAGGYYVLRSDLDKPMPGPATVSPYDGNGLLAVLVAVGGPAGLNVAAVKTALMAAVSGDATEYNKFINGAGQADPVWNMGVSLLIRGMPSDLAWGACQSGQGGITASPMFTSVQLAASLPVINGFR